jgi:trichodiene synthase
MYKEFDDSRDQTNLINNRAQVEGITQDQSLQKLVLETISLSERIVAVFADKDVRMQAALLGFMHGYVTWHLCDKRYRMNEHYKRSQHLTDDETAVKFCGFYRSACAVAQIDPSEWAEPSCASMVERMKKSSGLLPSCSIA